MTNFLETWQINSIIIEVMESSDFKHVEGRKFWDERMETEIVLPEFEFIDDFIKWFAEHRYKEGLSEGRFNLKCELKAHFDAIKQMVNV